MSRNPYAMDDDEPIDHSRDEIPAGYDEADAESEMRNNRDVSAGEKSSGNKRGKCGCGCVMVVVIFLAAIIGFIFMGVHYLKNSTPFTYPTQLAAQHPIISSILGTPLEIGMMREGSVEFNNDDGKADIRFPITGPKGEADLRVQGVKTNGVWVFSRITCSLKESQQVIELAPEPVRVDARDGDDL